MTSAEYQRQYYAKNKEKVQKWRKEYNEKNREQVLANRKEYYEKNKERIVDYTKKYIKKNRKKVTQMVLKRRKEVALELKKQGQIYTYLSKTDRENKMVTSLSKKCNISEETARQFLINENWNYQKIMVLWEETKAQ